MANEIDVTLPSGGKAWLAKTISHGQYRDLRLHQMRIWRYLGEKRSETGEMVTGWKDDLTPEDLDAKDRLTQETASLQVRAYVLRWEDVTDPAGEPLTFPDDVDRMQQPDFEALFEAASNVNEKDAEGNSSKPSVPA